MNHNVAIIIEQEQLIKMIDDRVHETVKAELSKLNDKIKEAKRDILTQKEACAFLGVSGKTLYSYIKAGKKGQKLSYEKSGKYNLFKLSDLIAFQANM